MRTRLMTLVSAAFLVAVCGMSLHAQGQRPTPYRWGLVYSDNEILVEVDLTTVKRTGEEFGVFIKEFFGKDTTDRTKRAYTISRWSIDCSGYRFKVPQGATYSWDDSLLASFGDAGDKHEWQYGLPGSRGEAVMGLCKRRGFLDGSYYRSLQLWADSTQALENERQRKCVAPRSAAVGVLCQRLSNSSELSHQSLVQLRDSVDRALGLSKPRFPKTP